MVGATEQEGIDAKEASPDITTVVGVILTPTAVELQVVMFILPVDIDAPAVKNTESPATVVGLYEPAPAVRGIKLNDVPLVAPIKSDILPAGIVVCDIGAVRLS